MFGHPDGAMKVTRTLKIKEMQVKKMIRTTFDSLSSRSAWDSKFWLNLKIFLVAPHSPRLA